MPVPMETRNDDQVDRFLQSLHTIDELLFPETYYTSSDDVYFETPDSIRAANKLRKCYFWPETEQDVELPPLLYYTWYDLSGRVEQTAAVVTETRDSLVHKWKYTAGGEISLYCSYSYEKQVKPKSGWFMSGDSILFKRDAAGRMTQESRYAVRVENKVRSNYVISTTTFKYDANGLLLSRSSGGYTYKYFYDKKGHPAKVNLVSTSGHIEQVDSLCWIEGEIADTIDHYALVGGEIGALPVDMLVINRNTGEELRYFLFIPKYNFIRGITGPLDVRMEYDAGGRTVKKSIYNESDTLLQEFVYTYDASGIISRYTSSVMFNPETQGPPPPSAIGHNNLYIGTEINFAEGKNGGLPSLLTVKDILFDLKPDSREHVAEREMNGKLKIVQEHHP